MSNDPQLDLARRAIALRDKSIQKEKRKMTEDLITQLREAGHEAAAQQVLDTELARQLEAAGHGELAARLTGGEEQAPAPELTPAQREVAQAEHFAQELKDKNESAWTSGGRLLEG